MNHVIFRMAALILFVLGIGAGQVRADKASLEGQLQQDLNIQLEDVTIIEALDQIGQKADLKIVLTPQALWKLPEGEQTRLSVTLEGRLSESLATMLNGLFLRYAVGGESLTIYPRPELKHVIGRPTPEELRLLTNIYTNEMGISISTNDTIVVEQFTRRLFQNMAVIMPPEEISSIARAMQRMVSTTRSSSKDVHDPNSSKSVSLTMALLLEAVEQSSDNQKTWYIRGPEFPRKMPEIRIVSREEFWQKHLDQIVDISFRNESAESILEHLMGQGDLELRFEAQWVRQEVADSKMTLEVQNVRLIDAVDRTLSAASFPPKFLLHPTVLLSEGVIEVCVPPEMRSVEGLPVQTTSDAQTGAGYVGKISIPMEGGKYFIEFMLRESDLTEELRLLRQQKLSEILEQLSKAAREQSQ